MAAARCDGGTLYLLEGDALRFARMTTLSLGIRQGGHGDPIALPPVPMEPRFVCAWAALRGETVSIPDVPAEIMIPRNTWDDPNAYDEQADKLAKMFTDNFAKKYPDMPKEILEAWTAGSELICTAVWQDSQKSQENGKEFRSRV